MSRAFFNREIKKTYRAIVQGSPQVTGVFDTLFGRHPSDRLKFTSKCSKGKSATTRYRRLTNSRGISDVEIDLGTGRTHQIRVHFSEHGFPLLGDPLYRSHWQPQRLEESIRELIHTLERPALHAWKLEFYHPCTKELLKLEAPIPDDMKLLMEHLI